MPDVDTFVLEGLARLQAEAFGPTGFAVGADEVVQVVVCRDSGTLAHGCVIDADDGTRRDLVDGREEFSYEALILWLDEYRSQVFVPGSGTRTTAEVHIYPDRPGSLAVFDEEHLKKTGDGGWYPGAEPATAGMWARQLLAYPRTADKIPGP